MTTPPWRASGAPSNSNWSIAVTLLTTARPAAKSSTISKLSTIASALTALWVTFLPLTSNSKTTNKNDRFYCPFFRGKPKDGGSTEVLRRMNGGTSARPAGWGAAGGEAMAGNVTHGHING